MSRSLAFVRVLPRRAVSRAVGALARTPLPRLLRAPALGTYARAYGAKIEEASQPLDAYPSFLDFFTRTLKDGARPLPHQPDAILSPCDGRVHTAGPVSHGMLLQAKGVSYSLDALLASSSHARALEGGTQLTAYLAPGDYHRFHWPFDAIVRAVRLVPGDLWPVHPPAVRAMPGLFARNERVVLEGSVPTTTADGAAFAVVLVGAMNVGSIRLACHPLRTNRGAPAVVRAFDLGDAHGRRGDEMGWFELGSTIVVLLAADGGRIDPLEHGTPLRARQAIGRLREAGLREAGLREALR